jgi:hypothetical protein
MTTTPLPEIDIITADRRIHVEYRRSLHVSGPFNGPLTSKFPMSTSTSLSRIREAGWPLSGTIIRGTLKTPNSQLVTPISIKLQRPDGCD